MLDNPRSDNPSSWGLWHVEVTSPLRKAEGVVAAVDASEAARTFARTGLSVADLRRGVALVIRPVGAPVAQFDARYENPDSTGLRDLGDVKWTNT